MQKLGWNDEQSDTLTDQSPASLRVPEVVVPGSLEAREWAPLAEAFRRTALERGVDPAVPPFRALIVAPPSSERSTRDGLSAAREGLVRALASGDPVGRVFVLSSMRATGATERTAGFAAEDQAAPSSDRDARRWLAYEKEMVAQARSHPGTRVVVLRCCFIEGLRDHAARLLQGRVVWSWMGFDPPIQVLPRERFVDVLWRLVDVPDDALSASEPGAHPLVLHLAPDDAVPLSLWLRGRGRHRIAVPGWCHRLIGGLQGTGLGPRRLLQRPATLDNRRLRRTLGLETVDRMAPPGAPYDGMGWKQSAVERLGRWCMEPLRRRYWRVSDRGADLLPTSGPTILVGIHRGYVPLDAMMLLHLIQRRVGRTVRFLIHPALLKWPFLANLFPAIGGLVASAGNAERVLEAGGMLGVFPEGVGAAMTETRRAYPLQRFLSDDFARWAVQADAKIVPVALVGPAESLPIFRRIRWRWWRRHTGWPTFPIGFLFPFGPPIPLPSKWHILFLEPIGPEDFEHEDEGERARELARVVRARLDEAVRDLVRRRRSVWRGDLASGDAPSE